MFVCVVKQKCLIMQIFSCDFLIDIPFSCLNCEVCLHSFCPKLSCTRTHAAVVVVLENTVLSLLCPQLYLGCALNYEYTGNNQKVERRRGRLLLRAPIGSYGLTVRTDSNAAGSNRLWNPAPKASSFFLFASTSHFTCSLFRLYLKTSFNQLSV